MIFGADKVSIELTFSISGVKARYRPPATHDKPVTIFWLCALAEI
jgi:hypothetical protein